MDFNYLILFVLWQELPVSSAGTVPIGGPLDGVGNLITKFTSSFPDSGRTRAALELQSKESLPIQLDNKYGTLQEFTAGIFKPQPLVDNTEEDEKYGNDAATGKKVANAIIGGFEGVSNILNAAVEVPFSSSNQFGRTITSSLNRLGEKLVGLA